jgi:hypothetical protein
MTNNAHIDGNGNIIVQGVDGSTIIINPDNTEELKKLIINLGNQLSQLPEDVLQMINDRQDIQKPLEKGANIYLTILLQTNGYGLEGATFKFGVTITNLTKDYRYFNQPFFKVNPAFKFGPGLEHDTFVMLNDDGVTHFPCRLEYGQPVSVSYPIKSAVIANYEQMLIDDENAYIQCFVSTTVGELYESNQYKISKLLENLKSLK